MLFVDVRDGIKALALEAGFEIAFVLLSSYQQTLEKSVDRGLDQTWLTGKNAVPVRLNQLGQDDVNNCLACVARLAHLAQSQ